MSGHKRQISKANGKEMYGTPSAASARLKKKIHGTDLRYSDVDVLVIGAGPTGLGEDALSISQCGQD